MTHYATQLHRSGFKVFPLRANDKRPDLDNWQQWAVTATEQNISDYVARKPDCNWGIFTTGGLFVLDVDSHSADGYESLNFLVSEYDQLPATYTVRTPSGGLHYYFTGITRNRAGFKPGLDIRGEGGFVVAPGSKINGRVYETVDSSAIAAVPAWLQTIAGEKDRLELEEDEAITEGSRNATLARLAGGMRANGLTYDELLPSLLAVNDSRIYPPLQTEEVETIARSICNYKPREARGASDFLAPIEGDIASAASDIDVATIPKRDWILAGRYIGGFITAIVAPGGVGKSTVAMLDAVCVATGRALTGARVIKQGGVWVYNTEDPKPEIERRMIALADHHCIPLSELSNVFITSGRDRPLIVAKADPREGVIVNQDAIEHMSRFIIKNKIVLLMCDPFVRTHEVSENDNMQMDKVVWAFQRVADKTGCAVCLVHHTTKAGDTARGASAFVNACRVALTVDGMTEKAAAAVGLSPEEAPWYLRMDNAKANLTPPSKAANWFKRVSVRLPNGDSVGTVEKVEMVDGRIMDAADLMNQKDVAEVLLDYMDVGQLVPVSIAGQWVKESGLFSGDFLELVYRSISYDGSRFLYQDGAGSQEKHWVKRVS